MSAANEAKDGKSSHANHMNLLTQSAVRSIDKVTTYASRAFVLLYSSMCQATQGGKEFRPKERDRHCL